jgi:integrase
MVFRRTGRPSWTMKARTRTGWQQLGIGTPSKALAERMAAMWEALAREYRAWDLLEPVLRGDVTIGRLYDLWVDTKYAPAEMRRRLADVDLEAVVAEFLDVYKSGGRVAGSVQNVAVQLRAPIPAGKRYPASNATPDELTRALAKYPGRAATRRKVHSSWRVFFAYCTRIKAIFGSNPMDAVERPTASRAPIRFYELADVERIIALAPSPAMAALWALMYGTGIEVSVALKLTRRDVDDSTWTVRARGTKTHTRDRMCLVAEWAQPILGAYLRNKLPTAPLWPGWNRYTPTDVHRDKASDCELPTIPLRNSRHHWAVRAARVGTPVAVIQAQLGHSSPVLTLSVYGRFLPNAADREAWEHRAAERDASERDARTA